MGTVILKLKPSNEPTISDELRHWGIPGMKWGRRRYQNDDGTLTEAGKQRYAKQKRSAGDKAYNESITNSAKGGKLTPAEAREKAEAARRIAEENVEFDVGREVKSDLDATETILRGTESAAKTASGVVKNTKISVPQMDLSKMSDKEMRDAIARARLEGEYDSMFNPERAKVNRGKERVAYALDTLAAAGGLAATGLGIALAIKQLKGG